MSAQYLIQYTITEKSKFKIFFSLKCCGEVFSVILTSIWRAYLHLLSKSMLQVYNKKASLVVMIIVLPALFF